MFDFDEIETDVQAKGASAWKEGAQQEEIKPEVKKEVGGGGGGMFDFDEIETEAQSKGDVWKPAVAAAPSPAKKIKETLNLRVGFQHKGHRWNKEFQVKNPTTILELKKEMCKANEGEAGWFQLYWGGMAIEDGYLLEEDTRLEFAYLPPVGAYPPVTLDMGEAPAGGWQGDIKVKVYLSWAANIFSEFTVKKGSTIQALQAMMSGQDPTGATKAADFRLCVAGSSGRMPLEGSTPIVDRRLTKLEVMPAA